jgi:hypothetical protein
MENQKLVSILCNELHQVEAGDDWIGFEEGSCKNGLTHPPTTGDKTCHPSSLYFCLLCSNAYAHSNDNHNNNSSNTANWPYTHSLPAIARARHPPLPPLFSPLRCVFLLHTAAKTRLSLTLAEKKEQEDQSIVTMAAEAAAAEERRIKTVVIIFGALCVRSARAAAVFFRRSLRTHAKELNSTPLHIHTHTTQPWRPRRRRSSSTWG